MEISSNVTVVWVTMVLLCSSIHKVIKLPAQFSNIIVTLPEGFRTEQMGFPQLRRRESNFPRRLSRLLDWQTITKPEIQF